MRLPSRVSPGVLVTLGLLLAVPAAVPAQDYVPPAAPGAWARREPAALGLDPVRLDSAIRFAQANEIGWARDMAAQLRTNTARERWPRIQGPYKDRGVQSGLILRRGYLVAEWGDTSRIDMTFSVAKSYLSVVAGLAMDDGRLALDEPVARRVRDGGYASAQDAPITWRQALTQTSEWEGTLWGKPDSADRRNGVTRSLGAPGSVWEYNDVRVNRLALSLLRVWERPLPEVLHERVMGPIGARDWVWWGYEDSFTELPGGRRVQSVSGGGHWGGGLWATTRDHARLGLLMQRRGMWGDRRLLSERYVREALTPTPLKPEYGMLWWLNTGRAQYPSATPQSFFALGAGGNVIWVAPELELVVVVRWLEGRATDEFMRLVVAAAGG